MSHFTSFAVAGGSGMMGRSIVDGLIAANAERIVVLSRSANTKLPAGVEVKAVDFDDAASVEAAIAGIDVVICTLRDSQSTQEPLLVRSCKSVGTKLFVPSEFGNDLTHCANPGPMAAKVQIAQLIAELGLPSLKVFTGAWMETTFVSNRFGYDFMQGKVELVGSGDEPWSWTSVPDTGRFIGALLVSRPVDELVKLGSVSIEGDRKTPSEVVALFEAAHPEKGKLEVVRTPLAASQQFLSQCEGFAWFTRALVNIWAQSGPGSADVTLSGTVKTANVLVPEWQPKSVQAYLAELTDAAYVEPSWKFYEA